jgi:beta-lactamase class A
MFKLFVLGAVAKQVQAQRVSWTQPIVIRDDLKSLPSGVLQNDPDGTTVMTSRP